MYYDDFGRGNFGNVDDNGGVNDDPGVYGVLRETTGPKNSFDKSADEIGLLTHLLYRNKT